MSISVNIDSKAVNNMLNSLSKKMTNSRKFMRTVATYMEKSTVKKIKTGKVRGKSTSSFTLSLRRGSGGGKTLMDNGNLVNSIENKYDNDKAVIGSAIEYAKIHNEGGTIRAKGKKLCIPMTKDMKKMSQFKGVGKTLDTLRSSGWSIFNGKSSIMGVKKGSKEKPVVLFALKDSVKIPKREYLYVSDEDEKVIRSLALNHIKKDMT